MTPRQQACLAAILRLTKDGVAPSLEELRVDLGYANESAVHRLLVELEQQGRIRRTPCRARMIDVLEPAGCAGGSPTDGGADPDKIALALIAERLLPLADRSRAASVIAGVLG